MVGRRAARPQQPDRGLNSRARGNHVVDDHSRPSAHIACDIQCGDRCATFAVLAHHRDRAAQDGRIPFGQFHRTQIRRNDHRAVRRGRGQLSGKGGNGSKSFDRDPALRLQGRSMRVDDDRAISSRGGDRIGDNRRADGLAGRGATVLARIAEVRYDRGHPCSARATAGVEQQG